MKGVKNRFSVQFRKAKEKKQMLLWDHKEQRWLITENKAWLNWPGVSLIKKFK